MKNHTLMTDLYELTTAESEFQKGNIDKIVYLDGFFRKIPFDNGYALMGGVDDIIEYITNLKFAEEDINYLRSLNKFSEGFLTYLKEFKFTGDIYMIPNGTPVFENTPLITVRGKYLEAKIIETAILSYINGNIKFITGASRLVNAAGEIPIMEFGARRADGPEAATIASKCAYIAGACGTSNLEAGKKYNIPVFGTMDHSSITGSESEYEAFSKFAQTYPDNSTFLVDTYDTLHSGIPNAIQVAKDYLVPNGHSLAGIRIDSGDLAYLTKQARKMLDEAGFENAKICISNGLTAEAILSLKQQGAPFDSIGAGDNITAPKVRVGAVYKLVAEEQKQVIIPKIKVSEEMIKTTNPGYKKVYRLYDRKTGKAISDIIALHNETLPQDTMTLIDPLNDTNQKTITNYQIRELQVPIFQNGKLVYQTPSIEEMREYCKKELLTLHDEIKRITKPAKYYVNLTEELKQLKKELTQEVRQNEKGRSYTK